MERQLKLIWSQVLDRPPSDIHDSSNFFESGGDSVMVIKLVGLANKSDIKLDAQTVFENPVFGGLVKRCRKLSEVEPKATDLQNSISLMKSSRIFKTGLVQCGVSSGVVEDIIPCSPFQRDMMAASHEYGAWLVIGVVEVRKGNEERVRDAFEVLRKRNPIFRTRIIQHGVDLYQVILKDKIDWHEEHTDLKSYMFRDLARRICYGDALCRYAIVRDAGRSFIVLTQSHATQDRWTQMLLYHDFREYVQDPAAFLKKPARPPYSKFISYISPLEAEGVAFWRAKLRGLARYDLLFKPASQPMLFQSRSTMKKAIRYNKPPNTSITFSTIVHVAWALMAANVAKYDDIFYCSFRSCRQMAMPGVESVMGPLWAMVPVRIRLHGEQGLSELLLETQNDNLKATPHEPFGIQAMHEHFKHNKFLQCAILPESFPRHSLDEALNAAEADAGRGFVESPYRG